MAAREYWLLSSPTGDPAGLRVFGQGQTFAAAARALAEALCSAWGTDSPVEDPEIRHIEWGPLGPEAWRHPFAAVLRWPVGDGRWAEVWVEGDYYPPFPSASDLASDRWVKLASWTWAREAPRIMGAWRAWPRGWHLEPFEGRDLREALDSAGLLPPGDPGQETEIWVRWRTDRRADIQVLRPACGSYRPFWRTGRIERID